MDIMMIPVAAITTMMYILTAIIIVTGMAITKGALPLARPCFQPDNHPSHNLIIVPPYTHII